MARFNEILVGRYNRALQKILSMKGPASLITLSDELFPIYQFFHGVENRYLEAWNRYRVAFAVGPVVAQTSACQMRNPLGSNVVGVIESMQVAAGVITEISIGQQGAGATADLTNVGTGFRLDPRQVGTGSNIVPSSANNVAQLPQVMSIIPVPTEGGTYMTDVINTENAEWPLLPGDALRWVTLANNTLIRVNLCWRERFLEESERA